MRDRRPEWPAKRPLRYAEAVYDLHGYPGAGTFTLSLYRQNNVPTRLEILHNEDFSETTDASVTLWGKERVAREHGHLRRGAWVTPTDFVMPVAKAGGRVEDPSGCGPSRTGRPLRGPEPRRPVGHSVAESAATTRRASPLVDRVR